MAHSYTNTRCCSAANLHCSGQQVAREAARGMWGWLLHVEPGKPYMPPPWRTSMTRRGDAPTGTGGGGASRK